MNPFVEFLKTLFSVTMYLRVMGVLTAVAGLALFADADSNYELALLLPIEAIPIAEPVDAAARVDYQPLYQHWGLLLALVGIFMVVAASKSEFEVPAMAISGVEKLFIAILGGFVFRDAFVTDFALAVDTAGAIYTLGYFGVKLSRPLR